MPRKIIMYKIQILPFVLCKRIGKHKDMLVQNKNGECVCGTKIAGSLWILTLVFSAYGGVSQEHVVHVDADIQGRHTLLLLWLTTHPPFPGWVKANCMEGDCGGFCAGAFMCLTISSVAIPYRIQNFIHHYRIICIHMDLWITGSKRHTLEWIH